MSLTKALHQDSPDLAVMNLYDSEAVVLRLMSTGIT